MAVDNPMEEFKKLDEEKAKLEAEIQSIQEYLTEDGMPGISGSLLDNEGFPRADIDVYAIRKARNRLACAQTDHVAVMKRIEQVIATIHAGSCVSVPRPVPKPWRTDVENDGGGTAPMVVELLAAPFALIDEVSEGSPAKEAGLAVGDEICQFGDIRRDASTDVNACFAAIAQLVPKSMGTPIQVAVLRGAPPERVELQLTPRQWAGRGLLGCHLAPKA